VTLSQTLYQASKDLHLTGPFDQRVLNALGEDFSSFFDQDNCPTDSGVYRVATAMACDQDEHQLAYIYTSLKAIGRYLRDAGFPLTTRSRQ
jgi:hypothetical protein